MIFAAKTTASGLIALLIAFTFNLNQPLRALLAVFIVSQAQQSGPVLTKAFYRVVGTLIGATVALLLVGLFAQERVLFLGALAILIGLCTFDSQYARSFSSGYTAAIVGVPGALPDGVVIASGMTATVVVQTSPRQWANLAALRRSASQ